MYYCLQGAKSEAEEFLMKEKDLHIKQAHLYQYFEHESNNNVEDTKAKKAELEEKLEYERKKLAETTESMSTIEKSFAEKKADYDSISEQLTTY